MRGSADAGPAASGQAGGTMTSLTLWDRACPRCRIRRTVRVGMSDQALCFNCRHRWDTRLATPFSRAELARLSVYRRAVQVGFYSDWTVLLESPAEGCRSGRSDPS